MREAMKGILQVVLLSWSVSMPVWALDGVFDYSADVDKYVAIMKEGPRGTVLPAAKDIYVSGISDPRLAAAIQERLMKDYPTLEKVDRTDGQYGAWLVKALASSGIAEYRATIAEVKKKTKSGKVMSACSDEIDNLAWHAKKNEIMASRKNFSAGGNVRAAQLHNLLQSDDFTYKYLAADRISWEKILEPALMDEIASQIPKYMNNTGAGADRIEWKTIGMYEKVLGYSSQPKYREVLQQVETSNAGYLVKKHAKEALERLN
jgi:hypothetical protein